MVRFIITRHGPAIINHGFVGDNFSGQQVASELQKSFFSRAAKKDIEAAGHCQFRLTADMGTSGRQQRSRCSLRAQTPDFFGHPGQMRGHERINENILSPNGSGLAERKPPGGGIGQLDIEATIQSVFFPDIQQQGHGQTVAGENPENNAPFLYLHDDKIRPRPSRARIPWPIPDRLIFFPVFYRYPV